MLRDRTGVEKLVDSGWKKIEGVVVVVVVKIEGALRKLEGVVIEN